jgi:hypothetical protein
MKRAALVLSTVSVALLIAAASAQAAPPTIGTPAVSEVGSESARLEAVLDPNGLPTAYRFEYVDLAAFSTAGFAVAATTPSTEAGAGTLSLEVSAPLVGLVPDTTYFARLRASNASGTVESKASTFVTSHGPELACEGDDCQILPPPPVDPTLTTLLVGLGNPKVHYHRLNHVRTPTKKKRSKKRHHAVKRGR